MKIFVIIGTAGSGKGTQSAKLAAKFGLKHISTGELIRKEIRNKTAYGIEAQKHISKGHYFPDEIAISMVEKILFNNGNVAPGYVFDGFPRTVNQAIQFESVLENLQKPFFKAIYLDIPEGAVAKRLKGRAVNGSRHDDQSVEVIRQRIHEHDLLTEPVREFYSSKKLLAEVNGLKSPEEVFSDICTVLN